MRAGAVLLAMRREQQLPREEGEEPKKEQGEERGQEKGQEQGEYLEQEQAEHEQEELAPFGAPHPTLNSGESCACWGRTPLHVPRATVAESAAHMH